MRAAYEMPDGSKLHMWGDDRCVQMHCKAIYLDAIIENIKKNIKRIVSEAE